MRLKSSMLAVVLAMLVHGTATAQGIYVQAVIKENDGVGARIAYRIKEGIRKSRAMHLTSGEEGSLLQLRISAVDASHTGESSVYAVMWTRVNPDNISGPKFYIQGDVRYCGSLRVRECAEELVVEADQIMTRLAP